MTVSNNTPPVAAFVTELPENPVTFVIPAPAEPSTTIPDPAVVETVRLLSCMFASPVDPAPVDTLTASCWTLIEFDAVVVADGTTAVADIKLVVLLQEAFRHCKALAAWGDGAAALKAARIPAKGAGVEVAASADKAFIATLANALGLHRAWDRAPKVMASAVPPVS